MCIRDRLYIILTSILGTAVSILIGVPIALLTAVFLTEVSNKKLLAVVQPAVELLAAIPSVIYGLLGLMILNPVLYQLEKHVFANAATHQFTGGSNLLAAIIVLAIMILPTVINMSVSSIPVSYTHLHNLGRLKQKSDKVKAYQGNATKLKKFGNDELDVYKRQWQISRMVPLWALPSSR